MDSKLEVLRQAFGILDQIPAYQQFKARKRSEYVTENNVTENNVTEKWDPDDPKVKKLLSKSNKIGNNSPSNAEQPKASKRNLSTDETIENEKKKRNRPKTVNNSKK